MKIDHTLKTSAARGFAIFLCLAGSVVFAGDKIPAMRLPVSDGFKFPDVQQEVDVYEVGRFDFNRDGSPEQIVITSGGGIGKDDGYVSRIIRLTLLSPEIIHAIIAGTLEKDIGIEQLKQAMPLMWDEQKKMFGME